MKESYCYFIRCLSPSIAFLVGDFNHLTISAAIVVVHLPKTAHEDLYPPNTPPQSLADLNEATFFLPS